MPDPDFPTAEAAQAAARAFRDDYQRIRDEIAKAVVGQSEIVDGVLTCLFAGGHALLEGVPGVGKTLLVRTLAASLDAEFRRIQFTPDLMPADVTGTTVLGEVETEPGVTHREFRFQPGPIFGQIVLADEINRATPKTQSALLEAMQERAVTVAGTTHKLPAPFIVLATQNPIEQEGTYPLPEAQLDRFFFKLIVGYATREQMRTVLDRTTAGLSPEVSAALDGERVATHQRTVRAAAIAPHIQDYAIRLVMATHPKGSGYGGGEFATPKVNQYVRLGASPRAAQTLVLAGKVRALLDDRAAVSADDLRWAALPTLRHRILLNFEGEAEGVSTDDLITNIVETTPVEAD